MQQLPPMSLRRQASFTGEKGRKIEDIVENFVLQLKRRQISGSFGVASNTAELLRAVVALSAFDEVGVLVSVIRTLGQRLQQAQPLEFAIGNIVRRVLYIIREEARKLAAAREHSHPSAPALATTSPQSASLQQQQPSLFAQHTPPLDDDGDDDGGAGGPISARGDRGRLTTSQSGILSLSIHSEESNSLLRLRTADKASRGELKGEIIGAIKDLIEEISAVHTDIREQTRATEHIHNNEVVMVYGQSSTVREFLTAAGKRCKFEVVVAEAAPLSNGNDMAVQLARCGIPTTLIADSAAFAMMARVNKVIVGVHAVMANGGIVGQAGLHAIAIAAHAHGVPFVACTGMYKLTPVYPNDRDRLAWLQCPSQIIPFPESVFILSIDSHSVFPFIVLCTHFPLPPSHSE